MRTRPISWRSLSPGVQGITVPSAMTMSIKSGPIRNSLAYVSNHGSLRKWGVVFQCCLLTWPRGLPLNQSRAQSCCQGVCCLWQSVWGRQGRRPKPRLTQNCITQRTVLPRSNPKEVATHLLVACLGAMLQNEDHCLLPFGANLHLTMSSVILAASLVQNWIRSPSSTASLHSWPCFVYALYCHMLLVLAADA